MKPGQRHRVAVGVADACIAYHHQEAGCRLGRAVPLLLVKRLLGSDADLQFHDRVHLVGDDDGVVVLAAVAELEGLAVGGLGHDDETARLLVVLHLDRGVRPQRDLLLKGVLVLGQVGLLLFCLLVVFRLVLALACVLRLLVQLRPHSVGVATGSAVVLVEALVGLLEEGNVVVELHEVERSVDGERAVVDDGVAQVGAVFKLRSALPAVGGIVGGVAVDPVEDGDEVERQLIAGLEALVVAQGRSEVAQTLLHRVLPCLVVVGIEVLIDGGVGLLDLGVGGTLEVHVQILGQVPANLELSVPEELLAEGERQLVVLGRLHVALLQLVVVARNLGVEAHALRQPVEAEALQNIPVFGFRLDLLERLEGLVVGRPVVVHRSAPGVLVLVDRGLALRVAVGVAVGEAEVGGS